MCMRIEDGKLIGYDCSSDEKKVVIPDGVKEIGELAFFECRNIGEVSIPDSVKKIGKGAFNYCTGMADDDGFVIVRNVLYYYDGDNSDVVIPSGVVRICDSAFCDTRVMITSVVIPDSVTEIGDGAFADCRMLKKVHMSANIRKIEDTAFVNCRSLTDIEIPDTIESIGDGAFTGCKALKDKNEYVIVNNCVYDYFGTDVDITIPDGVEGIKSIFINMHSHIRSIKIPSSVKYINELAFHGCQNLERVEVPSALKCEAMAAINYGQLLFPERNTILTTY